MPNNDTSAARSFHDATKLSYISLSTKPPLYKSYPGLPTVALPQQMPSPAASTLPAVGGVMSSSHGLLDSEAVAQLLHYSAGLIRRSNLRSAGEVHYRAAASAGALYPIELYLVCGDLPGLAAGIYHYAPAHNSLSLLRSGDFRGNLAGASAGHPAVADAPATVVCTCVFWRSAWKYRERGYRYCYWDNGTILANMTATASALSLPTEVVAGFVDSDVDALLGLESSSEASFCLVPIGSGSPAPTPVSPLDSVEPWCPRCGASYGVPRNPRPPHRLPAFPPPRRSKPGGASPLRAAAGLPSSSGLSRMSSAAPSPIVAQRAALPASQCPQGGWRPCFPPRCPLSGPTMAATLLTPT